MKQLLIVTLIAIAIVGIIIALDNFAEDKDATLERALSRARQSEDASSEPYKEIVNPSGFVNTDPITLGELVGKKVILLDIMTYSCINCQRTFPYLNMWYDKYRDHGLEIVGIHTPEFKFEEDINNVREAMERYGIEFPIVLDNDYGTWNAYANRWWPRKFLIDIDGNIVYDHIGEGGYGETEQTIQKLLQERADKLGEEVTFDTTITSPEDAEVVSSRSRSPETYFGTLRNKYRGEVIAENGNVLTFAEPEDIELNQLYLVGDWIVTGEYAEAAGENARIIFRYGAEKVFLVMESDDGPIRAEILRDGGRVGKAAGAQVSAGFVTVENEQLYRLIEDPDGWHTGVLEIKPEKPGLRAYAFTFG